MKSNLDLYFSWGFDYDQISMVIGESINETKKNAKYLVDQASDIEIQEYILKYKDVKIPLFLKKKLDIIFLKIKKRTFENIEKLIINNKEVLAISEDFFNSISLFKTNILSNEFYKGYYILMVDEDDFDLLENKKDSFLVEKYVEILFDNNRTYSMNEIYEILREFKIFEEISERSLKTKLLYKKILFSLSAGKYKFNTSNENNEFYSFVSNSLLIKVREYFNIPSNHILDLSLFFPEYSFLEREIYNEHELYWILEKFNKEFKKEYWSFRPPIIFRISEKESLKNKKDIEFILFKQIEEFVYKFGDGVWMDKNYFYNELNNRHGIKESFINQKFNSLEKMGLSIRKIRFQNDNEPSKISLSLKKKGGWLNGKT